MANWCDCELTVRGKLVNLAAFSMKVSSSKPESSPKKEVLDRMTGKPEERIAYLDATKIAPKNPDDKYKLPRDWNSQSGLPTNWILTNWGSTRPFCDVERKVRTRSIWFRFDSAWSPPIPLIKKMGERFPKLEFTLWYYEAGNRFSGKVHIKNGETTEEYNDNYRGRRGG